MFVEFKLYQTLAILRIAIQWLPLWAMNPCSFVKLLLLTSDEPIGVVVMLPTYCSAFESTCIE